MSMTLSKAVEILDLNIKEAGVTINSDIKEALLYGKESIERVDEGRKRGFSWAQKLLPTEIKGLPR